jgi:hypothetical protein
MSLTDPSERETRLRDVAWQIHHGFLRRVELSDGRAVLIDGDDEHSDDEIRAAVEAE